MDSGDVVENVIAVFLGVILVVYTFGTAITAAATATTTGWSTGVQGMWTVLQICIGVAGILLIIVPATRLTRG